MLLESKFTNLIISVALEFEGNILIMQQKKEDCPAILMVTYGQHVVSPSYC